MGVVWSFEGWASYLELHVALLTQQLYLREDSGCGLLFFRLVLLFD